MMSSWTVIERKEVLQSVGKIAPNTLVVGDCLDVMAYVPDQSIDLVLADLPYG